MEKSYQTPNGTLTVTSTPDADCIRLVFSGGCATGKTLTSRAVQAAVRENGDVVEAKNGSDFGCSAVPDILRVRGIPEKKLFDLACAMAAIAVQKVRKF